MADKSPTELDRAGIRTAFLRAVLALDQSEGEWASRNGGGARPGPAGAEQAGQAAATEPKQDADQASGRPGSPAGPTSIA